MADIYSDLRSLVFADPSHRAKWAEDRYVPNVTFHFDREYGDFSEFLLYKFFAKLTEQFGNPIYPVEINDGCIMAKATLPNPLDYLGRDFRLMMLTDEHYHELFREYDVNIIYVHNFDSGKQYDSKHNIDAHHFKVDETGKPLPIS